MGVAQNLLESFEMWNWEKRLELVGKNEKETTVKKVKKNDTRKVLEVRRWNTIGHVLKQTDKLLNIIEKGRISGKRYREQ